ncbi:MAG: PadR family transcriptional regulator [Gaiellaceae bacterium]
MRGGHARAARCRGGGRHGGWRVRARIERFSEPWLLLLLRDRPAHGYELLDQLAELLPGERIDMGNLYRVLRALEEDGLVRSEWQAELPGPAKRTYELTDAGRSVLGDWAAALERASGRIASFLERHDGEGR